MPVRTVQACWACADQQAKDEEIAFIRGMLDDGNGDRAVAVGQLADDCLGKPKAEIVGFGSSAGFDRDYYRHHPRQKICLISHGNNRPKTALLPLRRCEWAIYAKRPFAGPKAVLAYLGATR
jgi:hypothetical protein